MQNVATTNRRFWFDKRRQFFLRTHNETFERPGLLLEVAMKYAQFAARIRTERLEH
jgi:hypothetical protein